MNNREIAAAFLSDVYAGCPGDAVIVPRLSPFKCEIVPAGKAGIHKIDFAQELFFSVASYKSGTVQKNGKGRSKTALAAIGILHFDFDKKRFDDPARYFTGQGLPVPSWSFTRADRWHVYYLLDQPCTDFAGYEQTLKRLAKIVDADVLPAHPAALMRVPYTAHKKKGKTGPGYQLGTMPRTRYPLSAFSGSSPAKVEKSVQPIRGPSGAGLENILLKDRPKITSGGGRSQALYQFALRCRDFAVDEKSALGLVQKFNDLFCDPPEAASVVSHQTISAYRYAKHPPGRYLAEKPERMAVKFEEDCRIAELLTDFIYVAEAEILINAKSGLRYTKPGQIENAVCYATGVKTSLKYVLTFRLVSLRDRLAFRPEESQEFDTAGVTFYNTFEPLAQIEKSKPRKTDAKIFEAHLRYLTNSEEEFEHLRKFLACALLNPGRKIKHALLLISTYEGIGKSVLQHLAEKILRTVSESSYVVSTSNTEVARGNNAWIESKFLTFVHELGQSEKFAVLDQLKNWITEPRVRISDKYVRSFEIENFCNFIFFSNAVNALPISATDRRFFIIVNRKKPQSTAYYETLLQTFDEGLYSIIAYLSAYADKLNVNAPPPVTESKIELRGYSKNELTIFLDECLHDSAYREFFQAGFTIRSMAERIQDSAHASNVRFSQKQAAIWLRENGFYMKETHIDGRHARLYVKDNVIESADKFKKGRARK